MSFYLINSNIFNVISSSLVLSLPISTVGLIHKGGTGIIYINKFYGSGGLLF